MWTGTVGAQRAITRRRTHFLFDCPGYGHKIWFLLKGCKLKEPKLGDILKPVPLANHPGRFEPEKRKGCLKIDGPEPFPCLHIAD